MDKTEVTKNCITSFEEIVTIDENQLKSILMTFEIIDIIKASMGSSPTTNSLLRQIFPDIDFDKERIAIGNVRIEDVENIHAKIVNSINISSSL